LTALRMEFIRQAFLQAGRSETDAKTASEEGFNVFYLARNQVEFFPDVKNVLQQLANTYTLAAISNGNACIEKVGLKPLLSYQYSVEQVGVAKPHPAIFMRALDHIGAQPHETIHVGDHFEQDILGAKNTGLHAVWLNRKAEPRPDTHHEIHEIASLEELPTLIHTLDQ
ncbi:MAG TPA: HAD family hydrolase, partial [Pseudomonadales bacterium]|nr:HAD family hydrolase [Pseudomonadales bacterium]